jgi:hypothetical protein
VEFDFLGRPRRNIYDRLYEIRIAKEAEAKRLQEEQEALAALPPLPERFHTNELSFARPKHLRDKTLHVFTVTDEGPSPFSVVIGRTLIEPEADLETVAQRLLADLQKTLAHLEWDEQLGAAQVAGIESRRMALNWRQQGVPVHQVQVLLLHHDEHLQPILVQITGTSSNPRGMSAEERASFDALIETVELRIPPQKAQTA